MKKKFITSYFPKTFKYAVPVLTGLGIYVFSINHPVWGTIFILKAILILTTNYVTEINLQKNTCRDYLSLLLIPFNEDLISFTKLDRIIITQGDYAYRLSSWVQSKTINYTDYTGTLILDSGKVDLLTNGSKTELVKELKQFAEFLKIDIEDRTTARHYWIDLKKVI